MSSGEAFRARHSAAAAARCANTSGDALSPAITPSKLLVMRRPGRLTTSMSEASSTRRPAPVAAGGASCRDAPELALSLPGVMLRLGACAKALPAEALPFEAFAADGLAAFSGADGLTLTPAAGVFRTLGSGASVALADRVGLVALMAERSEAPRGTWATRELSREAPVAGNVGAIPGGSAKAT